MTVNNKFCYDRNLVMQVEKPPNTIKVIFETFKN